VYRTLPAAIDGEALCAQLRAGSLDAITFASPSAVRAFAALLDASARASARQCAIAAIGLTTAEALRVAGLPVSAVAERAGVESLAEALVGALEHTRAAADEHAVVRGDESRSGGDQ
jgi:uroporphyrinogen-III synthase